MNLIARRTTAVVGGETRPTTATPKASTPAAAGAQRKVGAAPTRTGKLIARLDNTNLDFVWQQVLAAFAGNKEAARICESLDRLTRQPRERRPQLTRREE